MSGFWAGGYEAYIDAVYKEYCSRHRELARQFDQADSAAERERIWQLIDALDWDYRDKVNAAARSIF